MPRTAVHVILRTNGNILVHCLRSRVVQGIHNRSLQLRAAEADMKSKRMTRCSACIPRMYFPPTSRACWLARRRACSYGSTESRSGRRVPHTQCLPFLWKAGELGMGDFSPHVSPRLREDVFSPCVKCFFYAERNTVFSRSLKRSEKSHTPRSPASQFPRRICAASPPGDLHRPGVLGVRGELRAARDRGPRAQPTATAAPPPILGGGRKSLGDAWTFSGTYIT